YLRSCAFAAFAETTACTSTRDSHPLGVVRASAACPQRGGGRVPPSSFAYSVASLDVVIRLQRAMPRPSDRQLALGVAGLVAIVVIELVLPAGYVRAAIAAIGWLGYSLGALLRVSQALSAARRDERLSWIFLGAGCVSWLVSTGYRSMLLIADVPSSPPSVGDAAALLGERTCGSSRGSASPRPRTSSRSRSTSTARSPRAP